MAQDIRGAGDPYHASHNGFNGFEDVGMRVASAQKMVGSATMSMDPAQLHNAAKTVEEARRQLTHMKEVATDLDEEFLSKQEEMLEQCEHQLKEAMR